jgi:hypothetical protein
MSSTWSISTSVVADVDDDFDDFCLPLPPFQLCKNDTLNEALMSDSELIMKKAEQVIASAQAKAKEAIKKVSPLDHYVERYVVPAVYIDIGERTTSSEFIPDEIVQYERKFGHHWLPKVEDKTVSPVGKHTPRWWHLCACTKVSH